ncbi:PE-PGRS family protein [Kitasatospora sp. NPDC059408]|uniref:PE-PGRS family protein n=1 Tax=Kitasatospora sp. NPDC059408 TaxID=3346823 RepID=UPI003686788E
MTHEPLAPDLRDAWAHGLAANPALPDALWPALLDAYPALLWSPRPPVAVAAALAHPEWKVRARAAESQPGITADQWVRLILDEPDARRRWTLTVMAADRAAELPVDVLRQLATDPSARVRAEAARLPGLPVALAVRLAGDADPAVRAEACPAAWPHLGEEARHSLLADPADRVREVALLLHHADHPMPRDVLALFGSRDVVLATCRLEPDLARESARTFPARERGALARNPHLPADVVDLLAEDEDEDVRFTVSVRPDLTEERRAAVRVDLEEHEYHHALPWVLARQADPDAMRELAASAHPTIRRSVARARRLPPDVVTRLAADEDRVVHLFLAESCDDAPAELLLDVWRWWTGSLSHPDRPHGHPNFPRTGLLRFADDPDPHMRSLALDDEESPPALVERFTRDPSPEVRRRAATDPRLTEEAVRRLLDDPDVDVRAAVAAHPRVPAQQLASSLHDPRTATAAARNPSLPADAMAEMVDRLTRAA